jgi:chromosomal replication initiator protein
VAAPELLDVFIAGHENSYAADCFTQSNLSRLTDVSPLMFYGPTGSGKTTLALSLAAKFADHCRTSFDESSPSVGEQSGTPRPSITAVTAVDFARQFTMAIEADDMAHFRTRHRECSLLLVDGIHELAGKPKAQEELVLTLDAMVRAGRPVIVTSARLPQTLNDFLGPLQSRLASGLSIPVHIPCTQTRLAILHQLAQQIDPTIQTEHLEILANRLTENTTALQLRGLLARWMHERKTNPTGATTESLIKVAESQAAAQMPSIDRIGKQTARYFKITLNELRSATRRSGVVRARGLAMHLMRTLTDATLNEIGEYFGGRDHTTVIHSCTKIKAELPNDSELTRSVAEIRDRLCA